MALPQCIGSNCFPLPPRRGSPGPAAPQAATGRPHDQQAAAAPGLRAHTCRGGSTLWQCFHRQPVPRVTAPCQPGQGRLLPLDVVWRHLSRWSKWQLWAASSCDAVAPQSLIMCETATGHAEAGHTAHRATATASAEWACHFATSVPDFHTCSSSARATSATTAVAQGVDAD